MWDYGQNECCTLKQLSNCFPTQFRCNQARQQSSAGIARRLFYTKRASRHHGGAARVKLGTKYYPEQRKKLSRFPTQFRCDQARQQMSAGTARRDSKCQRTPPAAAAGVSGHRPPHTKRASRHHGGAARVKLGTKYYPEQRKKLSRFPTQFRCDQARQQMSAGTARRDSKCQRTPPAAAAGVSGHRPPHTKRASRHHGGAARVKLGTKYYLEQRKKLSRFPTQFRCDQARQQSSAGIARRGSNHQRASPAAGVVKSTVGRSSRVSMPKCFRNASVVR